MLSTQCSLQLLAADWGWGVVAGSPDETWKPLLVGLLSRSQLNTHGSHYFTQNQSGHGPSRADEDRIFPFLG